jgi:hypothetical protein
MLVCLIIINISISQARYIRLPTVNCSELSPIGTPIIELLNVLPSANWEFPFFIYAEVLTSIYFLNELTRNTSANLTLHFSKDYLFQVLI